MKESLEAQFEAMYRLTHDNLVILVYSWVHNHDEAEEIVQETFYRAWKAFDRQPVMGTGWSWLARIARNLVIDRWRHKESVPFNSLDLLLEDASDEFMVSFFCAEDSELNRVADRDLLNQLLANISERDRQLLWLRANDYTFAAAGALDAHPISAGNAKVRVNRALRTLKNLSESVA